jgi:hypothetical protein
MCNPAYYVRKINVREGYIYFEMTFSSRMILTVETVTESVIVMTRIMTVIMDETVTAIGTVT